MTLPLDPTAIPSTLAAIPPAPREPSRRAREWMLPRGSALIVVFLFAAVFIVGGLLVLYLSCARLPVDFLITLTKQESSGVVLSSVLRHDLASRKRRTPSTLTVGYSVDGQRHQAEITTRDSEIVEGYPPGAQVPLEFAEHHPVHARIRGTTVSPDGYAPLAVLAFPLFGVLVVVVVVGATRQALRTFRDGTPTLARVVYVGEDDAKTNRTRRRILRYAFDVDGRTYEGTLNELTFPGFALILDRDSLPVLFDPRRPSSNTIFVA